MNARNSTLLIALFFTLGGMLSAQQRDQVGDTQIEPPEPVLETDRAVYKDSLKKKEKVKLDGIAAVVGDYVILDSDVAKTLIDLENQGASTKDITHCSLLGKLMEDRLYAHQAVQDSILVSDDEVNATGDRQIQQLVSQVGSMEKVLEFYNKEDVESFREELFNINKLRMLSEKMQQKIIGEIQVTPEEVRQFFNRIPEDEKPVFGAELEIAQIVKEPEIPEEEKQKVIDKLNEIKADVEDNDASFSVKAILYSQDPGSKSKGGFYSMTRQTPFVKEFKDVAFSLREGEISEPFETVFGFHIIYIEKIRGQELDLRHILIQPEIPQKAIDAAKQELDTIRQHILEGKYTFAEAALNFSDEKETKFDGGLLRNPTNFDSRFELTKMDPTLYNQVRDLKDNEISNPILETDPRGGPPKYKILKVTNRYDEHEADFAKDYLKIQELALREKQFKAIRKWMDTHIEDTYISVNAENRDCEFQNNWVKD
ncbi:peptidylprolyl isomerase [Zeaxanthinibacter enoshimensis]|uniref:Peptidyl-prolyl cis-trans isomerase SurA n=1 Tax=Zeaxanthinibacter enoshimensis TaxID=392009 RepID=A0A4R6TNG4_9FLAO|nr:peptidylprolyl isomerase [Zeaxanthinibacter enoshimensis]TDQ30871.1 peptidyl-prolyl cis-trans isomerase SurA [Zeaxanthinibacter enoshimensis]